MSDQDFTFEVVASAPDYEVVRQKVADAIFPRLKEIMEEKIHLSWDVESGNLTGEITINVPEDYDLEDPMTEETVISNTLMSVDQEFEELFNDCLSKIHFVD